MEGNNRISIKPINSVFSGHELVFIPVNPKYKPSSCQINTSLEILEREYPNCEIESLVFDSVEFIDQGQNFEKVICNVCKKELTIDFWQGKMSAAYEHSHFEDMSFETACCQKVTNLNELIYESDCGFASYRLLINNAEHDDAKEVRLKERISDSLGCDIKVFWKHI